MVVDVDERSASQSNHLCVSFGSKYWDPATCRGCTEDCDSEKNHDRTANQPMLKLKSRRQRTLKDGCCMLYVYGGYQVGQGQGHFPFRWGRVLQHHIIITHHEMFMRNPLSMNEDNYFLMARTAHVRFLNRHDNNILVQLDHVSFDEKQ